MSKLLWTNRSNFGPSPRFAAAMCYDSTRNRAVLFGGQPFQGAVFGDTWEWDGSFWTQMEDIGPAPRFGSSMVYDTARKVSLLFGGSGAQFPGDTWQWNGEDWTKLSESGPTARNTAMAFDSTRNRTVLFAGRSFDNQNPSDDTWEFDGENWTQVQDAGPPSRVGHAMAFDNVNSRVILFGGIGSDNKVLSDTWAWDGKEWVQIAEFGPSPRVNAAMVSAGASNLILFGGADSEVSDPKPQVFGDTWEFDGKRWTQRQDLGPGPLILPVMVFDTSRSRVVLFGGLLQGEQTPIGSGLTWELPMAPVIVAPAVLKVVSISVPDNVKLFAPTPVTFTLNGPAAPGGTAVHLLNQMLDAALNGNGTPEQLLDVNGSDLLNFTVAAGLTTMDLLAKFACLGRNRLTAGIQDQGEAAITVNVTQGS